ncbi:polyprenyl synthetase family protein [Kutzneria sp. CA-103260]|uniref:polyprenyl synthetase family protein n=1 Tax=Kutzneria sp. CA-103260 TaxID=2802641 RepID=UPI001BAC8A7C|nr:polyprenyl synthetase family protein [Kutzneria sp. CA-103260]QUQ68348.1 Polyprenyl synthetase [Kutzneria sp. CA-103260]
MAAADPFHRARELVTPGLRAAADRMNSATRQVIGYHFGWWDEHGRPLDANGGKAVRPALAMLAAEAVGGTADQAADAGVAVELAHNYSLLHDDVMDQDRTRRHRPTAWTVYGVPAAILAGDALTTLAVEALVADGPPLSTQGVERLNSALLRLIDGQAADTAFEGRTDVGLDECVTMAGDKTGALFAVACELGALAAGAPPERVWQLRQFGEHLGLAFQLVDDLLGIWGDPESTGKPVLSDLRSRKKSLPVVAALNAGNGAAGRLVELYHRAAPLDDAELRTCADLIEEAGGRAWAHQETQRQLDAALACLQAANPDSTAAAELGALASRLGTPPAKHAPTDSGSRSFELPEFQINRAARLNPQLETARAHTKAWAGQMGLLDPSADVVPWTEAQLAANDFGLLCSHTFPDAPVDRLTTVTDWHTWLFHLDDYIVEAFTRTGDVASAKAYLARIPRFAPVDPGRDLPTPANPTERGLADLWSRTASTMSHGWRCRLRAALEDLLTGHLLELRRHTSDPVEYLEMKRKTNGGRLAAGLAEFAQGAELPAAAADSSRTRALVDAVTDSALLLNDIFSYDREAADAGETANMVLVLKDFLGCDVQQAVNATNDMITARVRRFEHIAGVDMPELCEDHRLGDEDRAAVLGFVDSLRDWLPGWLEWHKRAARYRGSAVTASVTRRLAGPTGFGTATARRPLVGAGS